MTTENESKKVKVYLINPGAEEEIIIGNNYNPEALNANNAKFVGEMKCTQCLRNLRDGRANFENTEKIKKEIANVKDYITKANAYIGSEGFFRVHNDGLNMYEEIKKDIEDASTYVSEFEKILTELIPVKQTSYKPIRTWMKELTF